MGEGFELDWHLEVDHDEADRLQAALAPETDDHAALSVDDGTLTVDGAGTPGESLHTLDDLLACLTGALAADEVDADTESP